MSTLQNQLAVLEREEVGRAVRGLLREPWLSQASDPALYEIVRRRQSPVRSWFDHYLGWPLVLDSGHGYARVVKAPPDRIDHGDLRPERRQRSSRAPFDRLRYILVCVVAAEALDVTTVTIGELADRVAAACAADDLLPKLRTDRQEHRRALVDVILSLEARGCLTTIDGQTQGYTDDAAAAVLYRVNPQALQQLLACSQGPSLAAPDDVEVAEAIAAITNEAGYGPRHRESARLPYDGEEDPTRPTSAQRSRWARHSLLRRLFDDAAVHRDDLTEAELAYAASITGRAVIRQAAELSGFVLEERAEGYLLVDPDRNSGPDAFPSQGAPSAAALHLITAILAAGPNGLSLSELEGHLATLMEQTPAWARTYREDEGCARLAAEALGLLTGHQLARLDRGRAMARPAAARYREATVTRPVRRTAAVVVDEQDDLFANEGAPT